MPKHRHDPCKSSRLTTNDDSRRPVSALPRNTANHDADGFDNNNDDEYDDEAACHDPYNNNDNPNHHHHHHNQQQQHSVAHRVREKYQLRTDQVVQEGHPTKTTPGTATSRRAGSHRSIPPTTTVERPLPAVRVPSQPLVLVAANPTSDNHNNRDKNNKKMSLWYLGLGGMLVLIGFGLTIFLVLVALGSTNGRNSPQGATATNWNSTNNHTGLSHPKGDDIQDAPIHTAPHRRVFHNKTDLFDAIRVYMLALVNQNNQNYNHDKDKDPSFTTTTPDQDIMELYPIEYWNVSALTDLSQAFSALRYPVIGPLFNHDLSRWDVSHVVNMDELFFGAAQFNQDLGTWQTGRVTSLQRTFFGASAFAGTGLEAWDTGRVQSLDATFGEATSFAANLSGWTVSRVTTMAYTFFEAASFQGDGLAGWDVGRVTSLQSCLSGLSPTANPDVSAWRVDRVMDMQTLFASSTGFNRDIRRWNTSSVEYMDEIFRNCSQWNQDISAWNVRRVRYMGQMFRHATAYNQPLEWMDKTPSLEHVKYMFQGATSFNQPVRLNVSRVRSLADVFAGAVRFNQDSVTDWDVSGVLFVESMFEGATAFDQDLWSRWNVSQVQRANFMFRDATAFTGLSSSSNAAPSVSWDSLTEAVGMFQNAVSFQANISSWQVPQLQAARNFLHGAHSFNHTLCDWWSPTAPQGELDLQGLVVGTSCPVTDRAVPGEVLCHVCE